MKLKTSLENRTVNILNHIHAEVLYCIVKMINILQFYMPMIIFIWKSFCGFGSR